MALADDSLKHTQRASLPFCRWRVLCTRAFSLIGKGDLRGGMQVDIDLREIETLLTAGRVAGIDIQTPQRHMAATVHQHGEHFHNAR